MTEPKLDGRTKRAADIALAKRQISRASYDALLAGEIDLSGAKELGRDSGPTDTPEDSGGPGAATVTPRSAGAEDRRGGAQALQDTPPQPISRIYKNDTTQECWCGCEQLTSSGKRWRPGHDQRAKGLIKRAVKEGKAGELPDQLKEYGVERGLT